MRTLDPKRALLHPLWGLSLMVMLVNDHLLRGTGRAPGWLTGKLSDLAGWLLFPMLLATLLRVRTRRAAALCHAACVALLLALETSPAFCAAWERTLGVRTWADPTDLIALASIAASWWLLVPFAERAFALSATFTRTLAAVGAVACIADQPTDPEPQLPPDPGTPRFANLFLWNRTGREVQVRVSVLDGNLRADCDEVQEGAADLLTPDRFVVARHVTVVADGRIALDELGDRGGCPVLLLSVDRVADTLVTWRPEALQRTDLRQPNPTQGIIIQERSGQRIVSAPAQVKLTPARAEIPRPRAGACAPPEAGRDSEWSEPVPFGRHTVRAVERGGDGCDGFVLESLGASQRWYACAPLPLPYRAGDTIDLRPAANDADAIVLESPAATAVLVRRGGKDALPGDSDCAPAPSGCGVARATRIAVETPAGRSAALASGGMTTLAGGGRSVVVFVSRAERFLVADTACDGPGAALGDRASWMWIATKEAK